MAGYGLNEDIDPDYADDGTRPDVKQHQIDHGKLHNLANRFDKDADPDDGDVWTWDEATGRYFPAPGTGSPGADGDPGIGFAVPVPWDNGATYLAPEDNDPPEITVVVYLGSAWACKIGNVNDPPDSDSGNWELLVEKGDTGSDGQDGSDGNDGGAGPAGRAGPSAETLSTMDSLDGTERWDPATGTGYLRSLDGDSIVRIDNANGLAYFVVTTRIVMGDFGGGSPFTLDFPEVPAGSWYTTNDDTPGNPPDWSLLEVGQEIHIDIEFMLGSGYRGFVAGGGGGTGGVVEPPPSAYEDLLNDMLATASSRAQRTVPPSGGFIEWANVGNEGPVRVGDQRGAKAWVTATRNDSGVVNITELLGGGVTWEKVAQGTQSGAPGQLRRGMALFVARETLPGSESTFTVRADGNVGALYTSFNLKVVQTHDPVPPEWLDLAISSAVCESSDTAGKSNTIVDLDLAAEDDAANRFTLGIMTNLIAAGTVLVPKAGFEEIGTEVTINNPNVGLHTMWNPDAADEAPTATVEVSTVPTNTPWIAAGLEEMQG